MSYKPLMSVQFKTLEPVVPWEFLDELIAFYWPLPEPHILDATVNDRRIWGRGKSRYKYIGMDIDPEVKPDVVGDNTDMPFEDESFDIIVYDPPHVPNQRKSMFARPYGTGIKSGPGGSMSHTYPPFLAEARRVLRHEGFLLVKLIDYTHCGKFHFATAEFWLAAKTFGFELKMNYVLPRNSVIIDPKWKKAYHPRQNHCTWMVFKKA
jgi:SAM-dependent methyltransferase